MITLDVIVASIPMLIGFAGYGAWVGRVQQKVNRNEIDIDQFKEGLTQHMADDATAHQRIANIEGQLGIVVDSLQRIEEHLRGKR
jgi:hypothetical protein